MIAHISYLLMEKIMIDIILYRNKGQIVNGGYSIDYNSGSIIFDNKMTSYDMVYIDYNFRWFSDE